MNISMFEGVSEYEKVLGAKFDLNVGEEDISRFDHYTGENKMFLVTFIMRWRNQALDKTRSSMQMAFNAIKARMREVKIEEARREMEKLEADTIDVFMSVPPADRTEEQLERVKTWLMKMRIGNDKLSHSLGREEIANLAGNMVATSIPAESLLFLQGDEGSHYFWILRGQVDLFTAFTSKDEFRLRSKFRGQGELSTKPVQVDLEMLGDYVATMGPQDGFGELSVLSDAPRSLSAATTSECILCRLDKKLYDSSIKVLHAEKMSLLEKKRLLGMLPAFSSWTSSALTHVSYTMTKVEYSMNDKIVMFGQALRDVFILVEGEVDLTTKIRLDKTNVLDSVSFTEVRVASLLSGSILGDLELTVEKSKTFRVTARVKSSSCVLLKISTDDFKDLILNAPDSKVGQLIRRNAAATSEFRKTRLLEAQEAKKLEKKEKVDKKNSEASTVAKLRSKVKRASFDKQPSFDRPKFEPPEGSIRRPSFEPVPRQVGRRAEVKSFHSGDFRSNDFMRGLLGEVHSDWMNASGLPEVNVKPERKPFVRPSTTSKKTTRASNLAALDPYALPGLRDINVPTSPKTLRRLKSKSLNQAPVTVVGALQSSFGDFVGGGGNGQYSGGGRGRVRKSFSKNAAAALGKRPMLSAMDVQK
ncbi:hypothetical protein TrRE_jg7753 [Triparma retinervis]|uniref:Cyclic nucleotide-binding domain-containing protein n=1 Tax=Triparma retinervis TaxID=2557542 RepID=A0A9W6ZRY6_9STRA|nr:hypothetical protein TrRE_jg7753 [Triparma retinervis]